MKKFIITLVALIIVSPSIVSASTYKIKDLTVYINEDQWDIITLDDFEGKKSQETINKWNINSEELLKVMKEQNIYLDSLLTKSTLENILEFHINIFDDMDMHNLHTYSDEFIEKEGEQIFKEMTKEYEQIQDSEFELKTIGKYKYYVVNYGLDEGYAYGYLTVINGKLYALAINSYSKITSDQKDMLYDIVKTSKYNLNSEYEKGEKSLFAESLYKGALGFLSVLFLGFISFLISLIKKPFRKNKKKSSTTNNNKAPKPSKKREKKLNNEQVFVCSNCGNVIKASQKKCPNCGETFEKHSDKINYENEDTIDKKYDDLNKLKELLDKKIITKAEFEKEKKKILK